MRNIVIDWTKEQFIAENIAIVERSLNGTWLKEDQSIKFFSDIVSDLYSEIEAYKNVSDEQFKKYIDNAIQEKNKEDEDDSVWEKLANVYGVTLKEFDDSILEERCNFKRKFERKLKLKALNGEDISEEIELHNAALDGCRKWTKDHKND